MVGGVAEPAHGDAVQTRKQELLRVDGFTRAGEFENVSFGVHGGEVVGLAGLVGAGRTELVEAIFGYRERDAGRIWLEGHPVKIRNPFEAVGHGLALVPDDRKGKGLVTNASVVFNLGLTRHKGVWVRPAQIRQRAQNAVADLRIRHSGLNQAVGTLSGGNQQKVVLGKWLLAGARVYFFDEPTRGIDIAAKAEIHHLISRLAAEGAGVVVVSSDIDEVLALASRILVMHRGSIAGEMTRANASEARIVELATGGRSHG
jgi:ribose transport system ATP-binding protein